MNNIKLCAALVCCLLSIISSEASAQSPTAGDDLILVRQTDKSPDAAVEAIRTYAENRKWVYLGANKVKPAQGEVIFVKVCVPEVAKLIFRYQVLHQEKERILSTGTTTHVLTDLSGTLLYRVPPDILEKIEAMRKYLDV